VPEAAVEVPEEEARQEESEEGHHPSFPGERNPRARL